MAVQAVPAMPEFTVEQLEEMLKAKKVQARANGPEMRKKLTDGGKEVQCGWLQDKYGVSWQIVPTILGELVSGKDAAKAQRVMQAMLKMVKLDIKKLKQAAKQK